MRLVVKYREKPQGWMHRVQDPRVLSMGPLCSVLSRFHIPRNGTFLRIKGSTLESNNRVCAHFRALATSRYLPYFSGFPVMAVANRTHVAG